MAARANPERDAQVAVVRYLRRVLPIGSKVNHVPNETVPRSLNLGVRAHVYQKRRAAGVLEGWPDLQCFLPGGRVVLIEMKAPSAPGRSAGVLSVEQQDLHPELRALGFHVGVATDIDTARRVLLDAGVPLREAAGQPAPEARVRLAKRPASLDQAMPF